MIAKLLPVSPEHAFLPLRKCLVEHFRGKVLFKSQIDQQTAEQKEAASAHWHKREEELVDHIETVCSVLTSEDPVDMAACRLVFLARQGDSLFECWHALMPLG